MWRCLLVAHIVCAAMPVKLGRAAPEFWARTLDGTFLKLRWDDAFGFRKQNPNGITGWCQILRSGGATFEEGAWFKFHKCAHDPCNVIWDESKHGKWGLSEHVQPVSEDVALHALDPPEPLVPESEPEPSTHAPPLSAPLKIGCACLRTIGSAYNICTRSRCGRKA